MTFLGTSLVGSQSRDNFIPFIRTRGQMTTKQSITMVISKINSTLTMGITLTRPTVIFLMPNSNSSASVEQFLQVRQSTKRERNLAILLENYDMVARRPNFVAFDISMEVKRSQSTISQPRISQLIGTNKATKLYSLLKSKLIGRLKTHKRKKLLSTFQATEKEKCHIHPTMLVIIALVRRKVLIQMTLICTSGG